MTDMKVLSLITNNWGQEIALIVTLGIVGICIGGVLLFCRDWLVSVLKIRDVLDKLDEMKRQIESLESKIKELKRQ